MWRPTCSGLPPALWRGQRGPGAELLQLWVRLVPSGCGGQEANLAEQCALQRRRGQAAELRPRGVGQRGGGVQPCDGRGRELQLAWGALTDTMAGLLNAPAAANAVKRTARPKSLSSLAGANKYCDCPRECWYVSTQHVPRESIPLTPRRCQYLADSSCDCLAYSKERERKRKRWRVQRKACATHCGTAGKQNGRHWKP